MQIFLQNFIAFFPFSPLTVSGILLTGSFPTAADRFFLPQPCIPPDFWYNRHIPLKNERENMENMSKRLPSRNYVNLIPQGLFLLSILLSVVTTYYVTGHYIDSDASSELVLAKHLAETGQILSQDWYYSTELRVLNTQLVYAPLFLIFEDWHMVRFVGALILQGIMILSYYFLLHEAGVSRRFFYLSASLLLLPVSVAYGRIVLYHCFYIPHIALSFFLVGLTLGFAQKISWRSWKPWLRLFLLLLFSFIGGLGGIRQLMITHAPLVLCIFTICFLEDLHSPDQQSSTFLSPNRRFLIATSLFSTLFSFIGGKVNSDILSKYYSFQNQSNKTLNLLEAEQIDDILYGFLHQFGYREHISMLSAIGILSLAGLFVAGYCIYVSIHNLKHADKSNNICTSVLRIFFFFYAIIMIVVFVLITDPKDPYLHPLYLTFCISWASPMLILHLEDVPKQMHFLNVKKLFPLFAAIILVVNGFANVAYFGGCKTFEQPYEGLSFKEPDKVNSMLSVASYLQENQYSIGHATFWNANVLTEMTDGDVHMIHVSFDADSGNIWYRNWLTSQYLREEDNSKPFVLMQQSQKEAFESSDSFRFCSIAYEDENYCVYDITNLSEFNPLLYS